MRLFASLSLLLIAACGGSSSSNKSDSKALDGTFCTTAACASSPCTIGCVYAPLAESCPADAPAKVHGSAFASCQNRCGLHTMPDGTSVNDGAVCWKLDESAPGCTYSQPGCHEYESACYPIEYTGPEGGAVICDAVDTCVDGGTPPLDDMEISCMDMSAPADLTTVD